MVVEQIRVLKKIEIHLSMKKGCQIFEKVMTTTFKKLIVYRSSPLKKKTKISETTDESVMLETIFLIKNLFTKSRAKKVS